MTDALAGIVAVLIAYLLGSIPSAYIAGRLVLGSDVRKAGHGIVGGLNVFRQAGIAPAAHRRPRGRGRVRGSESGGVVLF